MSRRITVRHRPFVVVSRFSWIGLHLLVTALAGVTVWEAWLR